MTDHEWIFKTIFSIKKRKKDKENYLFALVGRQISIQGKEVGGNWPVSQVMEGLVTLAAHRWGPVEKRPVTGEPLSTSTALSHSRRPAVLTWQTSQAYPACRRGGSCAWHHLSQEIRRDGPSTRGCLRKYFSWVLLTLVARQAWRKLLQTEIQQATGKPAQTNSDGVVPGALPAQVLWLGRGHRGYLFQLGWMGSSWLKLLWLVFVHLR